MKNKWAKFIAYVIGFPIVWNVITYILNVWIDKGEFQFKVTSNIVIPLICGCIIGFSLFLYDKKKQ